MAADDPTRPVTQVSNRRMSEKDSNPVPPQMWPKRTPSRLVLYPVLLAIPIGSIYAGIRLGSAGVGEQLMVSSQNGTPVENWTLFFIAASIALVMYANWAYNNRTLRFRLASFLVAATYIAAVFVFGVWGLYAMGIPSILCLFAWFRYKRRAATESPPTTD